MSAVVLFPPPSPLLPSSLPSPHASICVRIFSYSFSSFIANSLNSERAAIEKDKKKVEREMIENRRERVKTSGVNAIRKEREKNRVKGHEK